MRRLTLAALAPHRPCRVIRQSPWQRLVGEGRATALETPAPDKVSNPKSSDVAGQDRLESAPFTPADTVCRGRLARADASTTLLRIQQHRVLADPVAKLDLARQVVRAKIESQQAAARYYQQQGVPAAGETLRALQAAAGKCAAMTDLDALRGLEGAASAAWFGLFGQLLRSPWTFSARVRRRPTDPVNALLSLGYTWLLTRGVALCAARGLEVALGALHDYHPGRPSLACDLIEPLRIEAVDRWVLFICNRNHFAPTDFMNDARTTRLQPQVFPRVLVSWEEHREAHLGHACWEQAIASFIQRIRGQAEHLQTRLETPPKAGGSCKDVTG